MTPSTGDNTNTSTDNNNGTTTGGNNTDTTPYQVEFTPEQTVISANVFTSLLTENATRPVVIKSGENVTFTFAPGTMKAVQGKTDYDFGVKVIRQYDKIPESVQGKVSKDNFVAHIEYNYSGQLPGTAQIRVRLGSDYVGKTLYYYLEKENGSLKYIQSATGTARATSRCPRATAQITCCWTRLWEAIWSRQEIQRRSLFMESCCLPGRFALVQCR